MGKLLRIAYNDNDFWSCFSSVAQRIIEGCTYEDINKIEITQLKQMIIESAIGYYIAQRPWNWSGDFYKPQLNTISHYLEYFNNIEVEFTDRFNEYDDNSESVYIDFYNNTWHLV